jgi:TatD DNase family protein
MNLVDVHCHLDNYFFKDADAVIQRAIENNVKIITAGINTETNRYTMDLINKHPVFACLGLYPPDALKNENISFTKDIDKEIEYIYSCRDRIVGIGEVGMDLKTGSDIIAQEKTFRKLIELAIKIDKPLVIHSRKAESKVIEILEEYKYKKIVMHCFGGNHKLVRRIRENKWYFSIPTSIVRDEHFQKIIKETPLNLILTETDSPFLSPFKDKRNEPSFVIETIKIISKLRSTPEEDVANIIWSNAQRLFNIIL